MLLALSALSACAALVIDDAARELAADVKLAMKRSDLSLDWVARTIRVPGPKLSDQLLGKTPFTAFWRFGIREIRKTQFWLEFIGIQADRCGLSTVPRDLGDLLARVEVLVGNKPMVKAQLSTSESVRSA